MTSTLPFVSLKNFLDPQLTSDGQPYGPVRYKQIVKECYLIAKNCNTSYTDLMKITPLERSYLLQFIADEINRSQELLQKSKTK